jgi:hypothetical protein
VNASEPVIVLLKQLVPPLAPRSSAWLPRPGNAHRLGHAVLVVALLEGDGLVVEGRSRWCTGRSCRSRQIGMPDPAVW